MFYILEAIGLGLVVAGAYFLGKSTAHAKLADEWQRVEREWYDLQQERIKWHGTRYQTSSHSGEQKSNSRKW